MPSDKRIQQSTKDQPSSYLSNYISYEVLSNKEDKSNNIIILLVIIKSKYISHLLFTLVKK